MKGNHSKHKLGINLAMIATAVVVVILGQTGVGVQAQGMVWQVTTGILAPLHTARTQVAQFGELVSNLQQVQSRNADLQIEIAQLNQQLTEAVKAHQQLEQLYQQLELVELDNSIKLLPAQVLTNWQTPQSYTLLAQPDTLAGVNPGDYVVAFGHLVGQVVDIPSPYIRVHLVSDPDWQAAVTTSKGDIGRLVGNSIGVTLQEVSPTAGLESGGLLYLLNPPYPASSQFPIGSVEQVISESTAASQTADVALPSLTNLDYLLVIPSGT